MMKIMLLFILLFSFFSCELHEQEASVKKDVDQLVFTLDASERMFVAIVNDDYFQLKNLIEKRIDLINVPNDQGQLLLIEAIKSNRKFLSYLLVKNGADINLSDNNDQSALEFIDNLGGDDFLLWTEILSGDDFKVAYLNELSIALVTSTSIERQELTIKKLSLFLELGADVNTYNKRSFTLLMLAASNGLERLVRHLCERDDLDVNAKPGRYTALSLIERELRKKPHLKEIIEILRFYGAQ